MYANVPPELLLEALVDILNEININTSHIQDHQSNAIHKATVNQLPLPSPSFSEAVSSDFTHRTCARLGGESVAHLLYNQPQYSTALGRQKHQQQGPALSGLLAGLTPSQSAAQASNRERLKQELEAQIQEKKQRDRRKKEELKALEEKEEQRCQRQLLRAASQATTASNQYNYTYDNNTVLAKQDYQQQQQQLKQNHWNDSTAIEDSNALLHALLSAIEWDTSQHTTVPTSSFSRTNYHGEDSASPNKLPLLNSVSMLVPVDVTDRYTSNTIDRRNNYGDSEDGIEGDDIDIPDGGRKSDKIKHNGSKSPANGKTTNSGSKLGKIPPHPQAIHPRTWR
jgi:hypothetical protein